METSHGFGLSPAHPRPPARTPVPIRVVIVDEQPLTLQTFEAILQATPDIAVVGTATHSAAALDLIQQQHPDVLLLDLLLPSPSGLGLAQAMLTQHPATTVLLVTGAGGAWDPRPLLALGLRGYLTTTVSLDDLRAAVRAVAAGQAVIRAEAPTMALDAAPYLLTPRERAVLRLLAQGQGNEEMATVLHLSLRTIERCRSALRTKLAARSSRELLHTAAGCGLLAPGLARPAAVRAPAASRPPVRLAGCRHDNGGKLAGFPLVPCPGAV